MLLRHQGGAFPYADSAAAPRVLQLLPGKMPMAAARRALALATSLKSAGGEVIVAGGPTQLELKLRHVGVEHRPYEGQGGSLFRSSATHELLDTVHHRGLELIHVHGTEGALSAKAFAEAASLPLVMTCEVVPRPGGLFARGTRRRHLVGRPIIVRSEYAAACVKQDHGLPARAVRVVRPGVAMAGLDEAEVSVARKQALLQAWGRIDDMRPVILVPEANADPMWLNHILAAATDPDAPEAFWMLCGGAEDEGTALDRIVGSGAAERVGWMSDCADWPAAYAVSSVVVSLPEPASLICDHALAAQAMGRAVITTDLGAHAEAILPGKTGWLVRSRDPGSLVYAAAAAVDREPVVRDAMARAARTFVQERFSMAAMQAVTLEIYRQVLEDR